MGKSLFKYYKAEPYVRKLVKGEKLSFAFYSSFIDQNELEWHINSKKLDGWTKEDVNTYLNQIKEYINAHFCICCFTKSHPKISKKHWEVFAKTDGVCFEYDLNAINNLILKNNKQTNSLIIKEVKYGNNFFDITPFPKTFEDMLPKNPNENDAVYVCDNIYSELCIQGYDHLITDALSYKLEKDYKWENEFRIICRKTKCNSGEEAYIYLGKIIPLRVYVNKHTNIELINFLEFYSKQKGFEIVYLPII